MTSDSDALVPETRVLAVASHVCALSPVYPDFMEDAHADELDSVRSGGLWVSSGVFLAYASACEY